MATAKPLFLNNVASTVQAGSSAIGSASATGVNVATGDGAKFGTIGTDQFVPAVIVDTSTSPETVKEYVYVTAVAADALTVVRQAEDSSRFPASTATIAAGYTIAAVASRGALDISADLPNRYLKPDGALVQTCPRTAGQASGSLTSGTLVLTAIALPAGLTIGHIAYLSNGATSVPLNWWFGLFDNTRAALAFTANQTTTAWGANTLQSLAIATVAAGSASSFTTTYTGLHYLGIMVAATTPPTISGSFVDSAAMTKAPVLCGNSNTGQTTVPAFPFTANAPSGNNTVLHFAYVGA